MLTRLEPQQSKVGTTLPERENTRDSAVKLPISRNNAVHQADRNPFSTGHFRNARSCGS